MSCETCDGLLTACKRSSRDYTTFVLRVAGSSLGGNILSVSEKAARMAQSCKEMLEDFREHRRRDHTDLAGEAG